MSSNCRLFPNSRIKGIIELDDDPPKINKASIVALSKATKLFLNVYASHIHRHIVETDSSYPVKIQHIIDVANDPRYLMYQFLTFATNVLEATGNAGNVLISECEKVSEDRVPEANGTMIDDGLVVEGRESKILRGAKDNNEKKKTITSASSKFKQKNKLLGNDKKGIRSIIDYFPIKN